MSAENTAPIRDISSVLTRPHERIEAPRRVLVTPLRGSSKHPLWKEVPPVADIVPPPLHLLCGDLPDWAEEFWSRVQQTEACWLWTGATRKGCGAFTPGYNGWGTPAAHRIAYLWVVGGIPEGLTIDHLCRVKRCVNPAHLEPVANAENVRRRFAAQTHCRNGHPLGEFTPGVFRPCAPCQRESSRAAHYSTPTSSARSAQCSGCGEVRHLRQNGTLHKHKVYRGGTCPGSGRPPAEVAA